MTKAELEDMVVMLTAIVRRTTNGWERDFNDNQVKQIRKIWNTGLSEGDDDYWYDY